MDVLRLAKSVEQDVIQMRRYLHENPEVSMHEENTIRYVVQKLEMLGISTEVIKHGGVIGILEGHAPGKTIILRSDLDALPMDEAENNLKGRKKVVSNKKGAAHTCGHDAHMAMLLGAAAILSKHQEAISGKVIFAFEQGEEMGGGIQNLLTRLVEIGADGVWGIHVKSDLSSGKISVDPGPRMAGVFPFHINIIGSGGHGSRPDLAASPLDCFHDVYQKLQSLHLQLLNPFQPITYSIGSVKAGNERAANVIPDTLTFHGTARYLHMEQGELFYKEFINTLNRVCDLHHCPWEFLKETKPMDMLVYNNVDCAEIAVKALTECLGDEVLTHYPAWMASEPFAFYQKYFPGIFAFVGIENKDKGTGAEHHNALFDVDEDVLYLGVAATVNYAFAFLNNKEIINFEVKEQSVEEYFRDIGF